MERVEVLIPGPWRADREPVEVAIRWPGGGVSFVALAGIGATHRPEVRPEVGSPLQLQAPHGTVAIVTVEDPETGGRWSIPVSNVVTAGPVDWSGVLP